MSNNNIYDEFKHVKNKLQNVRAMKSKTLNDTFRSDIINLEWNAKKKMEILDKLLCEERILLNQYVVLQERIRENARKLTLGARRYDL